MCEGTIVLCIPDNHVLCVYVYVPSFSVTIYNSNYCTSLPRSTPEDEDVLRRASVIVSLYASVPRYPLSKQ